MATIQVKPSIVEEILEFLATAPTLEQIIAFSPSEALQQYSHYIFEKNRTETLSSEEQEELQELLKMNHFVNMLKIKARQKLANS